MSGAVESTVGKRHGKERDHDGDAVVSVHATSDAPVIFNRIDRVVEHVTCLGCGCACDDIRVTVSTQDRGERIVAAVNACAMGAGWFGDGVVPGRAGIGGADEVPVPGPDLATGTMLDSALDAIARLLTHARRPMVYLAPDLSCEAQRAGVALADSLRGVLDSVTSATTLGGVLAAQERGTATATLGEVRNRADLVLYWGVDPSTRYPRYVERYAPDAPGVFLPEGRRSRRVVDVAVAVDVGTARGPVDADVRFAIEPEMEVAVMTALTAVLNEAVLNAAVLHAAVLNAASPPSTADAGAVWAIARALAPVLLGARYVAIVVDAEPTAAVPDGRPGPATLRHSARIALAHALNGVVRCGVSTLRAGGNRTGADAVTVAQTGFPCAVDFGRGFPRYDPHAGSAESRLDRGEIDAVLVLGSAAGLPAAVRARLAGVPVAVVGPRASASGLATHGYVDTGVAGIHEAGTALRMDDVPLPLTAVLDGPARAAEVVQALIDRVRRAGSV